MHILLQTVNVLWVFHQGQQYDGHGFILGHILQKNIGTAQTDCDMFS
jgi:hypothetical protein